MDVGRRTLETRPACDEHIVRYFVLPHVIGQGKNVPVCYKVLRGAMVTILKQFQKLHTEQVGLALCPAGKQILWTDSHPSEHSKDLQYVRPTSRRKNS